LYTVNYWVHNTPKTNNYRRTLDNFIATLSCISTMRSTVRSVNGALGGADI